MKGGGHLSLKGVDLQLLLETQGKDVEAAKKTDQNASSQAASQATSQAAAAAGGAGASVAPLHARLAVFFGRAPPPADPADDAPAVPAAAAASKAVTVGGGGGGEGASGGGGDRSGEAASEGLSRARALMREAEVKQAADGALATLASSGVLHDDKVRIA